MDSLSPIDGRYAEQVDEIRSRGFTEGHLILHKAQIELSWLSHLAKLFRSNPQTIEQTQLSLLDSADIELLEKIHSRLSADSSFQNHFIQRVSELDKVIRHDTKAVELAIREILAQFHSLKPVSELTHIGLTSEDVTGAAYSLMFKRVYVEAIQPAARDLTQLLLQLASHTKRSTLMGMTHGQPATTTTFGKEVCVFLSRLHVSDFTAPFKSLGGVRPTIKFGGAVGTHAAMRTAFPMVNWLVETRNFVCSNFKDFDLDICSTQVPCREWMIRKLRCIQIQNVVLLDFARDMWLYISRDVLKQKVVKEEVGSSTMPHKVNPINFENAEGNLLVANSLIDVMCEKLGQSRLQRDLSDSTVIRHLGVIFGHTLIAYKSMSTGINRIEFNELAAHDELTRNPQILAEPIQTVLRKYPHSIEDPYDALKQVSRGNNAELKNFVQGLDKLNVNDEDQAALRALSPIAYTGYAEQIADEVISLWQARLEEETDRS